jgi:hypothetical protein
MTNTIKINNKEYFINLDKIEDYIFKDNDNNSSEKEITDLYQYEVPEGDDDNNTTKTLNTKQIRQLSVTNGNQISTFRYEFIRMLIENTQFIAVNSPNDFTYNAAISFNTLLKYEFIINK